MFQRCGLVCLILWIVTATVAVEGRVELSEKLRLKLRQKSKRPVRVMVCFRTGAESVEPSADDIAQLLLHQKALQSMDEVEALRWAMGELVVGAMLAENERLEDTLLEDLGLTPNQINRRLPIGNTFILTGLSEAQAESIAALEETSILELSQERRVDAIHERPETLSSWTEYISRHSDGDNMGLLQKSARSLGTLQTHNLPENGWNVKAVGARELWGGGVRGSGILFGVIDTGVTFRHPALTATYYGHQGGGRFDHNYAWWDGVRKGPGLSSWTEDDMDDYIGDYEEMDGESEEYPEIDAEAESADEKLTDPPHESLLEPESLVRPSFKMDGIVDKCGYAMAEPCDNAGHGTHVTSLAVGTSGLGVAPDARWQACRALSVELAREEDVLSCMNFFLAPTNLNGEHPRPDLRPHVINNSYGWSMWQDTINSGVDLAVKRLEAAGTLMVFAAGNSGPDCGTVHSNFSFVVGSVDARGVVSRFSSRGPFTNYGSLAPTMCTCYGEEKDAGVAAEKETAAVVEKDEAAITEHDCETKDAALESDKDAAFESDKDAAFESDKDAVLEPESKDAVSESETSLDNSASLESSLQMSFVTMFPGRQRKHLRPRIPQLPPGRLILKPDLMAPGQEVIGALGSDKLAHMSGTSMASPHVAGVALLLFQACPHLIGQPRVVQELLQSTAQPRTIPFGANLCGHDTNASHPNNHYGHGFIDIRKAIEKCR